MNARSTRRNDESLRFHQRKTRPSAARATGQGTHHHLRRLRPCVCQLLGLRHQLVGLIGDVLADGLVALTACDDDGTRNSYWNELRSGSGDRASLVLAAGGRRRIHRHQRKSRLAPERFGVGCLERVRPPPSECRKRYPHKTPRVPTMRIPHPGTKWPWFREEWEKRWAYRCYPAWCIG